MWEYLPHAKEEGIVRVELCVAKLMEGSKLGRDVAKSLGMSNTLRFGPSLFDTRSGDGPEMSNVGERHRHKRQELQRVR